MSVFSFDEYDESGKLIAKHSFRTEYFVSRALIEAIEFDDSKKLMIAIDHSLPELLQSPYKEALASYIQGDHRKAGNKPEKKARDHKRNMEIYRRVNYWKGRGFAIQDEAADDDAYRLTARELNTTPSTVKRVTRLYNKLRDEGDQSIALVARFYQAKGKGDK